MIPPISTDQRKEVMAMAYIIAFEGMSGAGKTTTARILIRFLKLKHFRMAWVNEKEYEPIRSWVIDWHKRPTDAKVFSREDIEFFARGRSAIHQEIYRQFSDWDYILLDRTVFTSMVYQSSDICSPKQILEINIKSRILLPRKVFFFTGDPEVCHRRIMERQQAHSGYNLPASVESLETIKAIGERYRDIRGYMGEVTEIDAETPKRDKVRLVIANLP